MTTRSRQGTRRYTPGLHARPQPSAEPLLSQQKWPSPAVRPRPQPSAAPLLPQQEQWQSRGVRRPQPSIKRTLITLTTVTTRQTLVTPTTGGQIRMARIWIQVETAETVERLLELYLGSAANAAADPSKVLETLVIKATGLYTSRIYDTNSFDRSPTALRDELISGRWSTAPTNSHKVIIEYREHMTNRPCTLIDID